MNESPADPARLDEPLTAAELAARGQARYEAKEYAAAIDDLSAALRLQPDLELAHGHRGIAYLRHGDFDAAIRDFSHEIELALGHDLATMLAWRARAYIKKESLAEARSDYDRAVALDPANAGLRVNRGLFRLQEDEDYEPAIDDLTEAIRLQPDETLAYFYRAQAYYYVDAYAESLDDYDTALRLDPESGPMRFYRGRVYAQLDRLDEAHADFTAAIESGTYLDDSYRERAEVRIEQEKFDEALVDLNESIRLEPDEPSSYRVRGRLFDRLEKFEAADSDFKQADALSSQQEQPMAAETTHILPLLQNHFEGASLDQLTITERTFPERMRADLQRCLDGVFATTVVRHFSGVRRRYEHQQTSFTDLVMRDRNDPPTAVPPQFEEYDIGEPEPIRCLKSGLWLIDDEGVRLAVFQESYHRGEGLRFQVAAIDAAAGVARTQKFFQHLEKAVHEGRSYRGKILSLERDSHYNGRSAGIKVHKLRPVRRDDVILPRRTLELLERNVIRFVAHRPQLAARGLTTKKGLLFYGPPGTGKTHTLHYLAAEMRGTTTLLISAEQVGLLAEYMTLARLLQPSMVVIEDADLIARNREDMGSACEELLLNKLLNEMDGLKEDAEIMFILTTNRPEALEAALASRPGRIDQAIEFPHPDEEGRAKLIRLYSGRAELADELVAAVVRKTAQVSAAFIKELMRRATQFQIERGGAEPSAADIDGALEELLFHGGSLNRALLGGERNAEVD